MVPINKFHYKLFIINQDKKPLKYLGNAFPLTSDCGFLTCKHVVNITIEQDQNIAILDNEMNNFVAIPRSSIITHNEFDLDLAYIDNALQRKKEEFLPILTPNEVKIGSGLDSFGYFLSGNSLEQGFFSGNIINIFCDNPKYGSQSITLPFPILEGMSGCPLGTYHNGRKLVGMGYGNRQSRILASEILEYKDDKVEYTEKVHRIIEYGIGYHAFTIVEFLNAISVNTYIVSNERLDMPELG